MPRESEAEYDGYQKFEQLTPSALTKKGARVRLYIDPSNKDDYGPQYRGIARVSKAEIDELANVPGAVVYTGMHKENDWTRTFWWDRGWHFVNRSGDYAVVLPESGARHSRKVITRKKKAGHPAGFGGLR